MTGAGGGLWRGCHGYLCSGGCIPPVAGHQSSNNVNWRSLFIRHRYGIIDIDQVNLGRFIQVSNVALQFIIKNLIKIILFIYKTFIDMKLQRYRLLDRPWLADLSKYQMLLFIIKNIHT